MITFDMPRIYVVCLRAYNSGTLHGEWIDCSDDADNMQVEINAILSSSPVHTEDNPCEEWAIHDHENFGEIEIGENESLEEIAEIFQNWDEHGDPFLAYYAWLGYSEGFEDSYCGEYSSEKDYVYDFLDNTGAMEVIDGSCFENYIDYDAMARDWFMCDLYSASAGNGNIYVFHNC